MTKRQRPIEDKDRIVDSLDEMEQQAKGRIKEKGRANLDRSMNLDWSDKDPDFFYYWVTDADTAAVKPPQLLQAGYEFVRMEHGSNSGNKVIKRGRDGTNSYLMRIPMEWHLESQQRAQDEITRKEGDLNRLSGNQYGGDSKEKGEGKAVSQEYVEESGGSLL